ncbi:MAG: DegT/DnrJ/EryC1/StrS family aminotransferase [Candidatus Riflebacteria bacterium]|nr:DegT/DnrJ/EryC1/StrS family aminotransferase [Candidatus Riflebacteria bacterium]
MNPPGSDTKSRATGKSYLVPFVDAKKHYRRLKSELDAAIFDCLENGDLILRKQLAGFERNLAEFVGTKYAVGVASGYHALHFSLLAAGIGAGDEVITVAHTFVASVSAILHAGAKPVLVDVTDDFNMDLDQLERALTPRTRAIMPVHLNGRLCDMGRLMSFAREHRLVVVEDACQGLGATFEGRKGGSFGHGCFSFYPFKALGGFADGGAITTDDPEVARMATLLRYNGEDRATGEFHTHGYTALLDNIQAAVLDVKLKHFPDWIEHRRAMAERYHAGLSDLEELRLPHFPGAAFRDSYQNYVIRCRRRDDLRAFLTERGVETLVSWPKPMWRHEGLKLGELHLPKTEQLCREVMSLPMSAETTPEQVDLTVGLIREFVEKR